jgi:hypothetical protein
MFVPPYHMIGTAPMWLTRNGRDWRSQARRIAAGSARSNGASRTGGRPAVRAWRELLDHVGKTGA